jgi:hypothetical protein
MDDGVKRSTNAEGQEIARRALALWPRLNTRLIGRCRGDPWRIARVVARRTSLPTEVIVGMLLSPRITVTRISVVEGETWFG